MLVHNKLRLWQGQRFFLENKTYPELAVVSGVGYGKSHLACIKHHDLCLINRKSKLSLFTAPKLDLLVENNVPLYCSLLEHLGWKQGRHYWVRFGNAPSIEYAGGHRVLFRSSSQMAVRRIVSYSASHASNDEAGQSAETLPIEISKRVRCPEAKVLQTCWYGSPEGVGGFFFNKCNSQATRRIIDSQGNQTRFSIGHDGQIIVLHGWTEDNKLLSPQYISNMRQQMAWNPNLIRAYLYGEFVPLYSNSAYDFDPEKHKKDGPIWKDRPVYLTWDFNVTNGKAGGVSWVAIQEHMGDLHIVAENKGSSRTTFEAVDDFIAQFPAEQWQGVEIIVTGDSSGHSRDTRSYGNDYDIIRQKLAEKRYAYVRIQAPHCNPSVNLRIAAVNRLFSDQWSQSLLVRPKCIKTIDSLLQTTIDETGRIKKPAGETHTHYADAVGYGITLLRPIKKSGGR